MDSRLRISTQPSCKPFCSTLFLRFVNHRIQPKFILLKEIPAAMTIHSSFFCVSTCIFGFSNPLNRYFQKCYLLISLAVVGFFFTIDGIMFTVPCFCRVFFFWDISVYMVLLVLRSAIQCMLQSTDVDKTTVFCNAMIQTLNGASDLILPALVDCNYA